MEKGRDKDGRLPAGAEESAVDTGPAGADNGNGAFGAQDVPLAPQGRAQGAEWEAARGQAGQGPAPGERLWAQAGLTPEMLAEYGRSSAALAQIERELAGRYGGADMGAPAAPQLRADSLRAAGYGEADAMEPQGADVLAETDGFGPYGAAERGETFYSGIDDTLKLSDVMELSKELTRQKEAVKNNTISSPYSNLQDSKFVGEGKKFTSMQKKNIIRENMGKNGGVIRSDLSNEILIPATKSKKGVKIDPLEVHIDHIMPRSRGGTNSYSNAQVLSRHENITKSDK